MTHRTVRANHPLSGARMTRERRPLVEFLYFGTCPNWRTTLDFVHEAGLEYELQPRILLVDVSSEEEAHRRRFLGSPTVRVEGTDIEPGADDRTDFGLACRLYWTDRGLSTQPARHWLGEALEHTAQSRQRP